MKKPHKEIVYKEQITHFLLLLLDIGGEDVKDSNNFEEDFRKRLKFQTQTDWKRYRASIDLINDTEYAIISAFEYQLGDLNNLNHDIGETYIRLYGILNAVYLQMHAYKEVANLLNYPERTSVIRIFEELDIYRLRNMAGAHTTDYRYDTKLVNETKMNKKSTSFRIIQFQLEKTGSTIEVIDENNKVNKYNLLRILNEYEKIAMDLLIKLISHMTETLIYKKTDRTEIKKRMNEMLPNLIDYSTIDKNKAFKSRKKEKIKKDLSERTFLNL